MPTADVPAATAASGESLRPDRALCHDRGHVWHPRILPAGFIEPCIPTAARVPPSGPGWLHEIKHDGYRLVARLEGSRARLFSRRGFPRIGEALASLRARSMTIDGEAVVLCAKTGHSLFDELHSGRRDRDVILYAFDLIELSGKDERSLGSNFSLKKNRRASPAGPIPEARGRPEAALGGGDVTRVKIKPP